MGSVLVAYSGGVDSGFLSKVAVDLLAGKAVAVTAVSPSFPSYERQHCEEFARSIKIRHLIVETHEGEDPLYRANRGDRCYFCKSELYSVLAPLAGELGLAMIVNGTQADDLREIRPGIKAAGEKGIRSPLLEAGFTKAEIRGECRLMGLDLADKPANPCLASRLPVGTEVTPERLRRIDRIESGLASLGFRTFRVRFHEPIARIEVGPEELSRFLEKGIREQVTRLCRENGFDHASLDLEGYRDHRAS